MSERVNAYFSLVRTVWWIVLCGLAYTLGWLNSVVFVSLLSIWALVETSWAAYRADRNQKQEQQLQEIVDWMEKIEKRLSGGHS